MFVLLSWMFRSCRLTSQVIANPSAGRRALSDTGSSGLDARGVLLGCRPGGRAYPSGGRPKIHIRTTSPQAAAIARAANLAADSVELGDIFSTGADAIVSAANGVGHMNGGVDLRIRDRFADGRLEERVRGTIEEHHQGQLSIGQTFAIRTRLPGVPMRPGEPEWLIVSPTMTQPRAMSASELKGAVYVAALAALAKARDIAAAGVVLTTMGAGVGSGSHTDRGTQTAKVEAAVAGLDDALSDFQDIVDGHVSYAQALREYRRQQ
jgi:O-acetyl-ADP-ribose deacetylase (regulator of RNase III)